MLRDDSGGRHFDPRTVELKFDLQGENGIYLPFVVDIQENRLHWFDVYSKGEFVFNNVETSNTAITKICPDMLYYFDSGARISIYELALLHAAARGKRVLLRGTIIEQFEKALAINQEMGNRRGEGATLSNIGNIHYFRGDLDEARVAYENALEINREQAHLIGQATILGNLGRIYLEGGEAGPARECLHESLDLFREAGAKNQVERIHEMLDDLERTQNS